MPTRIAIIGGFLGAGKTTLINNLARSFKEQGRSVAIITNDQGEALVDTQYCSSMGIEVAEVLRGCFCCRFPELMRSARDLVGSKGPEIILAEPVGSCTDLLATVVAPLKILYPQEFTVAPLVILADAKRILAADLDPAKIGDYLRRHQIMEAEHVVLTKTEDIAAKDIENLKRTIYEINPAANIIVYSCHSGEGMSEILQIILSKKVSARTPVEIDYDIYAQAEAELGWYNGTYRFAITSKLDSYDLASRVLRGISSSYGTDDVAHAKVMIQSPTNAVKMSAVLGNLTVDAVKGSRYSQGDVVLTVNARIVSSPERLRQVVRSSVQEAMGATGMVMQGFTDDCFSPSRPNPTHRLTGSSSGNALGG